MKSLMQKFKSMYKVDTQDINLQLSKKQQENGEKNAERLTLELKVLFSSVIPMLKPYNGNENVVKLPKDAINIIVGILNSNNELITENDFFLEVKEFLQEILNNNDAGIELNSDYYRKARTIEKLCYSVQGKEYWEEK